MQFLAPLLFFLLVLPYPAIGSAAGDPGFRCAGEFGFLGGHPQARGLKGLALDLWQSLVGGVDRPQVADNAFEGNPLAEKLLGLAKNGQLINQTDKRLKKMGLHVPNGGLCVAACAVNLEGLFLTGPGDDFKKVAPLAVESTLDVYRVTKESQQNASQALLIKLGKASEQDSLSELEIARNKKAADGRYGAYVSDMLHGLRPLIEAANGRVGYEIAATERDMAVASKTSGLMFATARVTDSRMRQVDVRSYHALLIPKVDSLTKTIYVCDPNRPNAIYPRKYWLTPAGNLQFESLVPYDWAGPSYLTIEKFQMVEQRGPPRSLDEIEKILLGSP